MWVPLASASGGRYGLWARRRGEASDAHAGRAAGSVQQYVLQDYGSACGLALVLHWPSVHLMLRYNVQPLAGPVPVPGQCRACSRFEMSAKRAPSGNAAAKSVT